MAKTLIPTVPRRKSHLDSFTLIELLTVMAIIGILAAIILEAGNGVVIKAKRSRSAAEVQAMSTALESYKTDNGIYPQTNSLSTNYATADVTSAGGAYQLASRLLYLSLSGQTNFTDIPAAGTKAYMSFKSGQIGDPTGTSGGTYVRDPWTYSYGYSSGTTNGAATPSYPFNGTGFFDLWSTGGKKGTSGSDTNSYISNWQ